MVAIVMAAQYMLAMYCDEIFRSALCLGTQR